MDNDEEGISKRDKIKRHLKGNKKTYLGVGGGLILGVILSNSSDLKQIVGSFNLMYKSTATNIVIIDITRRAHPGYKIVNNITGEAAASIRRMAQIDNRSRTFVKEHTNGENPIYTILGEMA